MPVCFVHCSKSKWSSITFLHCFSPLLKLLFVLYNCWSLGDSPCTCIMQADCFRQKDRDLSIDIWETERCVIIASTALVITGVDVRSAIISLQLCAGQASACEAAEHSVRDCFLLKDAAKGVLVVNASNALNSLNRASALYTTLSILDLPLLLVY